MPKQDKNSKRQRAANKSGSFRKEPFVSSRSFAVQNRQVLVIIASLVAITIAVFGQSFGFQFVNFDDDTNVYENQIVTSGLKPQTVAAAFTHIEAANWAPLTVLSHALDYQLYGSQAGGHHLTNLLLHATAVVLLFLLLRSATREIWPSALVAALFAIHPLRAESVAWVSERKDVLSAVFFMLTLLAYVRYVRRPSLAAYLLVVLLFALGLLSKAMLVTLPLLLLLLDYWPLNRFARPTLAAARPPPIRRVLLEKLPLLVLSLASGLVGLVAQGHAVQSLDKIPIGLRFENALVSTVVYLEKLVWPTHLAAYYPYPLGGLPAWQPILCSLLLAGISAAAILLRRKHPYLLVGWSWYLLMLAPVIGIIQLGTQARADRYTYLPQIGLVLAFSWLLVRALARTRANPLPLGVAVALVLLALSAAAFAQTASWRNGKQLWSHAIAVTSANALAHNNLGMACIQAGRDSEALTEFQTAVEIQPGYSEAHNNLGNLLGKAGHLDEAIVEFNRALKSQPDNVAARNNLGTAYLVLGRVEEAGSQYELALDLDRNSISSQDNLNRLAWFLATSPDAAARNPAKAVELALELNSLTSRSNPQFLSTLAAAEAGAGHFDQALRDAKSALDLACQQDNPILSNGLAEQIQLYLAGKPYHK